MSHPPADPPAALRLFVGLLPDAPLRQAVLDWRARWQWPRGAALSSPAHLHLTLAFLGETEAARLPALRTALAAVPVSPLLLRLGFAEAWPRGLAVLRPQASAALDALHAHVEGALRVAGLAATGAGWKPHLTLARHAAGAQPPADRLELDWVVSDFALVWSRLPPQVPVARYEVLGRFGSAVAP